MNIFLDFDDVLFNTDQFRHDFQGVFEKFGIPREVFLTTYTAIKEGQEGIQTYDYERHLASIQSVIPFEEEKLRKAVMKFVSHCEGYVFSDALPFLEYFQSVGADMFLLSYGTSLFQKEKVEGSGIERYFKKMVVGDIHKGRALNEILGEKSGKGSWFFDDRVSHIQNVKQRNREVQTLLVSRPEGRYYDEKTVWCDFQVKSLDEARGILLGI